MFNTVFLFTCIALQYDQCPLIEETPQKRNCGIEFNHCVSLTPPIVVYWYRNNYGEHPCAKTWRLCLAERLFEIWKI